MKHETSQFLIYRSEDGRTKIDVMLDAETLWHIFEDGELDENSVVRFFRTTATDGKEYEVVHYNLLSW
jgi:hypothetical protein